MIMMIIVMGGEGLAGAGGVGYMGHRGRGGDNNQILISIK